MSDNKNTDDSGVSDNFEQNVDRKHEAVRDYRDAKSDNSTSKKSDSRMQTASKGERAVGGNFDQSFDEDADVETDRRREAPIASDQ